MSLFFTSDLHLAHQKVALARGFDNAHDHDEVIRKNWLEQVSKADHVWILGDLQMSQVPYALDVIKSLPGKKHLIAGNHDPCHPMHQNSYRFQHKYMEAFESVQAFTRRKVAGVDVLFSHFPYSTDHTHEVRYTQYRLKDEGRWLVHGHTHGKEILHGHEIHVGLDAWEMKLVPFDFIQNIIAMKGAQDDDGSGP